MSPQRNTRQRASIEEAFDHVQRPLSPAEVADLARKQVPRLGMATVYRALNEMVEAGSLRPVDLPGQSRRYEKAGLSHHHHFHCLKCDRVFDLEGCLLRTDVELPEGFVVKSHDITLNGMCSDCGG